MRRRGLVIRRAFGHRLLIIAASATALFAVTVLAALGAYAATVSGKGVRDTLAGASFGEVGTQITTSLTASDIPQAQRKVAAAVRHVYGHVPAAISLSARGDSYALPGQEWSAHPRLTTLATYDGIERHARLVAGRWPTTGRVEAVLPVPAAKAMRLAPGRTVTLRSRVGGPPVTVTITGVFEVRRADDYFWGGDRLVATGAERLEYTTFGPLVVPPATFGGLRASVTARWLVFPAAREIRAGELDAVAARARALPGALGGGYTVKSSVAETLAQTGRALLVARSTLLIPALQLVVLAVYTLTLVARLLAEHRRVETTLMRARGASTWQLAGLTVAEGVFLSIPAAVGAPFLAPLLAGGDPPTGLVWGISVAGALVCAAALALPPLRGVRQTYVAALAARGRGERRAAIQRAGGDLALVVLAALAVWQLAHYGGPVTTTAARGFGGGSGTEAGGPVGLGVDAAGGSMGLGDAGHAAGGSDWGLGDAGHAVGGSDWGLGIDPLIVAGPALALLAGGVLILRLVPLVSRAGERATTRTRGLAPAVATRQVSRRPLRTAGPALLLVMTVAVGVLSVTTGVTWRRSQADQANFQASADLRVTPPDDAASPRPPGQGARYAALRGVTAVSPVLRDVATTGGKDVTVLAVDAAKVGGMLRTPFPASAGRLVSGRTGGSVPVPGRPSRLRVGLRMASGNGPADLTMIVTDAFHVTYEVDVGNLPADGRTHMSVVDLSALAGPGGTIAYPVSLRGFRFTYVRLNTRPGTLTVHVPGVPAPARWAGQVSFGTGAAQDLRFGQGGLLTVRLPTAKLPGLASPQVSGSAVVSAPAVPLPAIVTRDVAARAPNGRMTLTANGVEMPVSIAGVVPAVPSTGTSAVMVDWAALNDRALAAGASAPLPNEWWLSRPAPDQATPLPRSLNGPEVAEGTVVDRLALRHHLLNAPLGGALRGALVLALGAALVFAAIGFAVHTAVSARERAGEFGVLRALGVNGRQILGLITVEQAFLVGLGLLGGLALGNVLAHLVVPHVVLTAQATTPYPPVHVILRWPPILTMLGAIVLLLAGVLLLLIRSLRHAR